MKVVLERKDCIKHLVCKTGPNDITCPERCIHYEKENANSGYPLLADVGELIRIIEIFTDYADMNADRFNKMEREMIIDIETQLEKVRANVS